jgi:hypothetical protein
MVLFKWYGDNAWPVLPYIKYSKMGQDRWRVFFYRQGGWSETTLYSEENMSQLIGPLDLSDTEMRKIFDTIFETFK